VGQSFDRVDENGEKEVKKKEYPSLLLGDSMCVKNTDTAHIETKGYCHYKSTNGIKRHLLVDVLGNPYFVKCTPANLSDDEGLLNIIKENKEYFLNLPEGKSITILLDNGYHTRVFGSRNRENRPIVSGAHQNRIIGENHT